MSTIPVSVTAAAPAFSISTLAFALALTLRAGIGRMVFGVTANTGPFLTPLLHLTLSICQQGRAFTQLIDVISQLPICIAILPVASCPPPSSPTRGSDTSLVWGSCRNIFFLLAALTLLVTFDATISARTLKFLTLPTQHAERGLFSTLDRISVLTPTHFVHQLLMRTLMTELNVMKTLIFIYLI